MMSSLVHNIIILGDMIYNSHTFTVLKYLGQKCEKLCFIKARWCLDILEGILKLKPSNPGVIQVFIPHSNFILDAV